MIACSPRDAFRTDSIPLLDLAVRVLARDHGSANGTLAFRLASAPSASPGYELVEAFGHRF